MSSTSNSKQLVWYITGTSSGLGARLVNLLLERGDLVIATARDPSKLEFPAHANLRVQQCDVAAGAAILRAKAAEAVAFWGRVDVLVNNAGQGFKGILEEGGCVYSVLACMTERLTGAGRKPCS